ncbi:MAG: hypothetical protein COV78_01640 [Candidatus Pacebacteria bacterium CG11_big_fil_rev_8_21_14_0_20_34_55]|nr:MAG: hypothetical protein COV78_01640 [Candidatus Pacebacteria bacterium CG11_big_fil_rev_8_21_14_0_20_34_55]
MFQVMLIIVKVFFAFLIIIFGYSGFGLFLIKKIKLKLSLNEKLILATILGISLATTLVAFLGQFISTNAYYILLPIFLIGVTQYMTLIEIFRSLFKSIKHNILGSLFILFSIFIFTTTIIFSYSRPDGSFVFQEVHDSVWHIALIQNLQKSIPPAHPSTNTIILNNYHYFYDLFLGGIAKFTSLSEFILYYQVSVIFLSAVLVGSAYILGRNLKDSFSGYLLVGATVFIGSISYIIPLLFHPDQPWGESSFWVSQTLVMIVNPQVIYTLALTYLVVLLINKLNLFPKITLDNKKDYILLNILIIILVATSIGFKSYSWVILSVVYAAVLLCEFVKHKSFLPIFLGLLYIIVSFPTVWLITLFKGNTFFYSPLWYTNSMIESPDRVNYIEWKFLQDLYIFKKNWIELIVLEIKKIIVFYLGNLGIRSLFFAFPLLAMSKKVRENINWKILCYIFFGFLFSSIFPLLFLQKGTVWNSIQFWYYSLIFADILFVMFISEILRNKSKAFIRFIIIIFLVLALPTSIKTLIVKSQGSFVFNSEMISMLSKLDESDSIMICPEGSYLYNSSIVKTLTSANIFIANPSQIEILGEDNNIDATLHEIITKNKIAEFREIINNQNINILLCSDDHLTNRFIEMLSTSDKQIKADSVGSYKLINL